MRRKTLSRQKIEANRRNALKSTGPKTLRGKNYSRINALKYGLFAKDLFAYFMVRNENSEVSRIGHPTLRSAQADRESGGVGGGAYRHLLVEI